MKRKFLFILLLAFAFFAFFTLTDNVKAAQPSYGDDGNGYITLGSQKCFFANGTHISIEERDDGAQGAKIVWLDGTETKTVNVPSDINVFGGAHHDATNYPSTKITMNGGTVKNIFGGGLHQSSVTNAEVVINGGKVTGSVTGGGANIFANSDSGSHTGSSFETVVTNATTTINNGSAFTVYGGGEGYSTTNNATLNINGGTLSYVTAGGSNGTTGNANVKITSGQIALLQSVNRGQVSSADMRVLGGTIDKLYVGGETEDSNVTGSIGSVGLDITGGSVVNNLYIGKSGGQLIGTNGNNTKVDVDLYLGATVNIPNPSEFQNIPVTHYVFVTIDDNRFELETGKTLADIPELPAIKNVAGKEFVHFVKADTGEVFDEATQINSNTDLKVVYKTVEKPTPEVVPDKKDETPKTGENNIFNIIAITSLIFSLVGFVIASKIKR